MFERFARTARAVSERAQDEARALASPAVEAEHLLLALARLEAGPAARALRGAGLGHEDLLDALDAEQRLSLAAVGVALEAYDLPLRAVVDRPRWATSAKLALERALAAASARGDRRIEPAHLLLGVLAAREGTVPRALAFVDVDPRALASAAEAELDTGR
jgi:ATP-dependent Clp protease ATP-binding subunit ClpA